MTTLNRQDRNLEPAFFEQLLKIHTTVKIFSGLDKLLHQIVFLGRDILRANDVSLVVWDSKRKRFVQGASTDHMGANVAKRVRQAGGASRWVVENNNNIVVHDIRSDPFTANRMIVENNVGAYIGVPIVYGGAVLGVLYSLFNKSKKIEPLDIQKLQELAMVAAVYISNAQRIQAIRKHTDLMSRLLNRSMQEIVQPLSLVIGFCELTLGEMPDFSSFTQKHIDVVQRSHQKMSHLIQQTRLFERLVNRQALDLEPVCFNKVAFTVRDTFQNNHQLSEQKIMVTIDRLIPKVLGDFNLLMMATEELVDNSFKFSDQGDVEIETMNEERYVVIAVKDSGVGLTKDQIDQIFEPFTRFNQSETDEDLGLGLSFVQSIIHKHDGFIQVDSELGKGSQFRVYLPKSEGVGN